MKAKWMGALVAAGLFAVPAMAQENTGINAGMSSTDTSVSTESTTQGTEVDLNGTGGSGLSSDDSAQSFTGTTTTDDSGVVSGTVRSDDLGTGGSYNAGTTDQVTATAVTPVETTPVVVKQEDKNDMRGLQITVGGGMEGYTGRLRSQIDPGLAWGVTAVLKPTRVFGLELGYTGAANEIGNDGMFNDTSEAASGADIVRNGGQAVATLGLSSTAVQPYALAGVGLNRYTVRANTSRFHDDWSGNVPVGAGIRTHVGNFTADLRGSYSFLVDNDFASSDGSNTTVAGQQFSAGAGRWNGTLQLGTPF